MRQMKLLGAGLLNRIRGRRAPICKDDRNISLRSFLLTIPQGGIARRQDDIFEVSQNTGNQYRRIRTRESK